MTRSTRQFFCIIWCLLLTPNLRAQTNWLHAGPLYDQFSLTLADGERTEALGPLFYSEKSDTQKIWGVPPLFWDLRDPTTDVEKFALGYPVFTYNRYGTEHRWQLFQVLSFAGGKNQRDENSKRFTVFPFYFSQRSPDTNQNYTALLPFYGHLKNRIFTEESWFVMFPLYSKTRKADVITKNYLFPFVSFRHGNSLEGWKFLPIAGHEHKGITSRTNGFGDVELIPGHDRRFILAPFYVQQLSGIGTENPADERAFLPFYSRLRSPLRDSTTVIWPFFTHITEREKNYREWQAPWPFVDFARGEGKTISRIFPFYSRAQNTNQESGWYLWPMYKYNRVQGETLDRKRTRIFLFLYSDTVAKNKETGKFRERKDFWPLFTQTRDLNGNTRLQVFAPVEPILPFSDSVEREYSPVWSVWRAEKNPGTGAASLSLLWNLYRQETTPTSKKCSLLFGLFQYQSSPEGRIVRWFHLPVKKFAAKPPAAAVFDETLFEQKNKN